MAGAVLASPADSAFDSALAVVVNTLLGLVVIAKFAFASADAVGHADLKLVEPVEKSAIPSLFASLVPVSAGRSIRTDLALVWMNWLHLTD